MDNKPLIFIEGQFTLQDLESFRAKTNIWQETDIFELQQRELFEINNPSTIFSEDFEQQRIASIEKQNSEQDPKLRGAWIYFPWSGMFIHCVNEKDYRRLRTNRNRNLVTEAEQLKLLHCSVGLVGLSVGSNVAAALVYSGIGTTLKLAEFDILETTNLNRIRANLEQIGTSKIELLERQLYEIDPFLDIQSFPEKISKTNLDSFVNGTPRPDVIFEIIDSFEMKIHLRALARSLGIPVIMVTNLGDRLLIDVERYDLNKDTKFFNGRAGKIPEDILHKPDLTAADKHKYAVELAGVEHIPQKAMDSVSEIGKTLVGRPQLASTVAIAGGVGAYIVRKIILDHDFPSCSWLIDLDKIFTEENAL